MNFQCYSYFYKEDDLLTTKVILENVPKSVKNPIKGLPDIQITTLEQAYDIKLFQPIDELEGYSFLNWVIKPK